MRKKIKGLKLIVVLLSVFLGIMSFAPASVYAANSREVFNKISFSLVFNPFSSLLKLGKSNSSSKTTNSNTSSKNDKDTKYSGKTISKNNIVYKNTSSKKCVYDVKYVDDGNLKPIIIAVHGGTWRSGNKSGMNSLVDYFVPMGYVVANVEYEMLNNGNYITGQISEVMEAVKAIASAASDYQGDRSRIAIAGMSSGAQVAVRVVQQVVSGEYDFNIKAILDFCGYCDMSYMRMPNYYSYMIDGRRNVDFLKEVKKIDPMRYITSSMPPTLVMHSSSDNVVPIGNAESFYNALIRGNVKAQFLKTSGVGHGIFMNKYGTAAKDFLSKYV